MLSGKLAGNGQIICEFLRRTGRAIHEMEVQAAAAAAAAAGRVCGFDMVTNRANNQSKHAESAGKIQVSAMQILAKS